MLQIARRGIVLVACPATIAFLDLPRHAPVRSVLAAGGIAALASDYKSGNVAVLQFADGSLFRAENLWALRAEAL